MGSETEVLIMARYLLNFQTRRLLRGERTFLTQRYGITVLPSSWRWTFHMAGI